MAYIHVEINTAQSSKHAGSPCGDVVTYERRSSATTVICCDGIGSGIKANLAANMCASRLKELLRGGFSIREAFSSVAATMNQWRSPSQPYAAFALARILGDGSATVLSYESPPPILVGEYSASIPPQRMLAKGECLVSEAECRLEPGDGLLLMSDGITQAGIGYEMANGWQIEGVRDYVESQLRSGADRNLLPELVHRQARQYWSANAGDDCTVAFASCRYGKTVNILTGPPSYPSNDSKVVSEFLSSQGAKVVCGATTAVIVSRQLGQGVEVIEDQSLIAPPRYFLHGIDLVTEGAITLNQVFNILDEDPAQFEEQSGVTKLWHMLNEADCIRIIMGGAMNPASQDIVFRQRGILTRSNIVPLLADKLRRSGKLVLIRTV